MVAQVVLLRQHLLAVACVNWILKATILNSCAGGRVSTITHYDDYGGHWSTNREGKKKKKKRKRRKKKKRYLESSSPVRCHPRIAHKSWPLVSRCRPRHPRAIFLHVRGEEIETTLLTPLSVYE
ncbi:hypothetical protein GW17_00018762 [Ensete ventricosum]|nr:hypothetical protein GW17_00018762 [Ensete ventricosum]